MPLYNTGSPAEFLGYSGNASIDGILSGLRWVPDSGGTTYLTVSFPWFDGATAQFDYTSEPQSPVHLGMNAEQRQYVMDVLQTYSDVANIQFTIFDEDSAGNVGDIRLAFSDAVGSWWGWGNYPYAGGSGGDIWINPDYADKSFAPGTYNYEATAHELGHALGLDHPFDGDHIVPAGFDDRRYTVMSYTDPATVWWYDTAKGEFEYLLHGLMVTDIAALQYLYGANMSFHTGNDVYRFDPAHPFMDAIWDAGGRDRIDLSNFTAACTIDLTPGAYSSLSFNDLALDKNLGIAFNCVIENATGGSGSDVIRGNNAANVLDGGAGDDILYGGGGSDILRGGLGSDTADYSGTVGALTISLAITVAQSTGGAGSDKLDSIENLIGGGAGDTLIGNDFANRIDGGGGNDIMRGGLGDDVYVAGSIGDRAIESAGQGVDQVLSAINFTLGLNVENLTLIGTALKAFGNGLDNAITGNDRNNTINGRGGADLMTGGLGNDIYYVDNVGDQLIELAGQGRDRVWTSISATIGANIEDMLLVGTGAIDGTGNALANLIQGNEAANVITGGAGKDLVRGRGGADTFVFDEGDLAGTTGATADRIFDFAQADGDRVDLSGIDANSLSFGDQSFTFIGLQGFHGVAGELRYTQSGATTFLTGDINGDGTADFMIRMDGLLSLSATDFIF